jgi:hypothetical protein
MNDELEKDLDGSNRGIYLEGLRKTTETLVRISRVLTKTQA